MYYDVIVIGGGIAGATSAYFLKKHGLSVLLLERDKICSGGSSAAGAFLSPKISKPSLYKEYLNRAFLFSIDFYKKNFPKEFIDSGLLKIPYNYEDVKRCRSYEPYIDIEYKKICDNYFFPQAALVKPIDVCKKLLQNVDINENYHVKKVSKNSDSWSIDKYSAKYLILAIGSENLPIYIPYIKTKNIAGYRYDVKFKNHDKIRYNIFKEVSISTLFDDVVAIGATHIKPYQLQNLKYASQYDSFNLIKKAREIIDFKELKIINDYIGFRNSTFDYFPIVGSIIDAEKTLQKYPYISRGTKVPSNCYIYHDNLYIHQALGSRGFVYAPYNAKLLAENIVHNKKIDKKLSPIRLFRKWAVNNNMIY